MSYTSPSFRKTVRENNGHFKTNFSLHKNIGQPGANASYVQYKEHQNDFNYVPYGTEFESINQDETFIHKVDTFRVPADSHEITYTGTWSNSDSTSYKFHRGKQTSTSGDTITFDFSGVAIFACLEYSTDRFYFDAELSSDGGSTWEQKKTLTLDIDSGVLYDNIIKLYSGLPYGDYKVRLTNKGSYTFKLFYFAYTTYICQQSISQYYTQDQSGTKTLSDVPPTTSLWTVNSGININQFNRGAGSGVGVWNGGWYDVGNSAHTFEVEMKFYGSKIWANVYWNNNRNINVNVYIDGAQTNVKSTTFNTNTPSAVNRSTWIRLDDGTLSEGWHEVKLSGTASTSNYMGLNGWSWYSSSAISTICRSVICGAESYFINAEDTNTITYPGGQGWTVTDNTGSFLQRSYYSSNTSAYLEFTTPLNTKAIYLVCSQRQDHGEINITLDGGTTRYLQLDSWDNIDRYGHIHLLYDSYEGGGLDISNKTIRVTKNGGSYNWYVDGFIVEVGDPVETNNIFCMEKMKGWEYPDGTVTRGEEHAVSWSHRIDVYGEKLDPHPGRDAFVFDNWISIGARSHYWNHGLGLMADEFMVDIFRSANSSNNASMSTSSYHRHTENTDFYEPGKIRKRVDSGETGYWMVVLKPNRVI